MAHFALHLQQTPHAHAMQLTPISCSASVHTHTMGCSDHTCLSSGSTPCSYSLSGSSRSPRLPHPVPIANRASHPEARTASSPADVSVMVYSTPISPLPWTATGTSPSSAASPRALRPLPTPPASANIQGGFGAHPDAPVPLSPPSSSRRQPQPRPLPRPSGPPLTSAGDSSGPSASDRTHYSAPKPALSIDIPRPREVDRTRSVEPAMARSSQTVPTVRHATITSTPPQLQRGINPDRLSELVFVRPEEFEGPPSQRRGVLERQKTSPAVPREAPPDLPPESPMKRKWVLERNGKRWTQAQDPEQFQQVLDVLRKLR